ncbi:MAG: ATP synthase subunit I [Deltaproteobacteria bacterium]|nr:ATP synthase subunit I [Deltaproteobacteria bacterium]MBW2047605.1 ATP synthase subunit I [Deltaproteobacteria bacterium]MBW2112013.1 ATP synthase subunit I [Deltaproteobacteria bacterium]MBW2351952.1 ATP synthase subunit I [Deltaproteobacteria bacterium]
MIHRDKTLRQIRTNNWLLVLILGALSSTFMSATFTTGVIVGGLIIIANFSLLENAIRSVFPNQGPMRAKKISLIAKSYFRLAIMGLIIYILITSGWVNPIGLAVGLSTVVFSILGLGIRAAWKTSSREAV